MQCILCGKVNSNNNLFRALNPDLNDEFTIQECKKCKLKKTLIPKDFNLGPFYENTKYYAYEKSAFNLIKNKFSYILKRKPIERFKLSGNLLDIGCGDGVFLRLFEKSDFKLYGIEPFGKPNIKNPKIKILNSTFEETKLKSNYFDVITMWHVFEHVTKPNKVLQECKRLLKKDGVLFISIPNSNSLGFKLFKHNWFALYPPIHIYHYDLKSIKNLLKKNNFKIEKVDKFTLEYVPFVLLQSIQNYLHILPPNYLYKSLRGTANNKLKSILAYILALFLLPILFVLIILEFFDKNGSDVINICATVEK